MASQPRVRVVEGLAGETNTPGPVPHSSTAAAQPRTVRYVPAPLLSFPATGPEERRVQGGTERMHVKGEKQHCDKS